MLTGFLPYQGRTSLTTLHANMLDHQYDLPEGCSDDLADLFKRMFEVKPKRRITLAELWDHPWIKAGGVPPISPDAVKTALDVSQLDPEILCVMEECNFQLEETKKSVAANKCDPASATYHLLAMSKSRTGAVPQISGKVKRQKSLRLTLKQKRALAAKRQSVDSAGVRGPGSSESAVALRPRPKPNADESRKRKAQTLPSTRAAGERKATAPGKGRHNRLRLPSTKVRVAPAPSTGRHKAMIR